MPELKFIIAFKLGTEVCLTVDSERNKGIIVSVKKNWNGGVYYEVKFADDGSDWYQSLELEDFKKKKKTDPDTDDEENEGDIEK